MGRRREPRKPCILLPIYIGLFDLAMYVVQVRNYSISARLYSYWENACKDQPFAIDCNEYEQCHTWINGVYKDCIDDTQCQCVAGSKLYYPPIALILSLIVTFIYDIFDKLVPLINLWKMKFNAVSFDDQDREREESDIDKQDLRLNDNEWTRKKIEFINDELDHEFSQNKISSLSNSCLFLCLIFMNNYLWRFCIDQYFYKRLFFKYQRHHIIYYSIRYIPYIIITLYLYFEFNDLEQGIIVHWFDMLPMTGLLILNEIIKIIYRMNRPYQRQEHVAFVLKDYFGAHISSIIGDFLYDYHSVKMDCKKDNITDEDDGQGFYHKKLELISVNSLSIASIASSPSVSPIISNL